MWVVHMYSRQNGRKSAVHTCAVCIYPLHRWRSVCKITKSLPYLIWKLFYILCILNLAESKKGEIYPLPPFGTICKWWKNLGWQNSFELNGNGFLTVQSWSRDSIRLGPQGWAQPQGWVGMWLDTSGLQNKADFTLWTPSWLLLGFLDWSCEKFSLNMYMCIRLKDQSPEHICTANSDSRELHSLVIDEFNVNRNWFVYVFINPVGDLKAHPSQHSHQCQGPHQPNK